MDGTTKHRRLLFFTVLLAGFVLLGMAVGSVAIEKINGDPAVLDDIDKHFRSIPSEDETQAAPVCNTAHKQATSEGSEMRTAVSQVVRSKKSDGKKKSKSRGIAKAPVEAQDPAWPGIREVAPATYTITDALFSAARADFKPFIRGVRAVMAENNGVPAGFRILNIFPGSALFACGLRHGDILTAVNGHNLDSVDEALLAAATLKTSRRFRVDLRRNGSAVSLYYRVSEMN